VELHQLQCFIAVLEEGGFKRATARLGITQPALSYQIKRLEEELGVQVFHRGPGGITPTEAGRVLLEHAHRVIASVREAHQAVRELSDGVTGEIGIGTMKCIGTYFLPQVLWEIRAKHPMVRPRILYRNSDELLDSLLANKLDVVVVANPPPDDRLEYRVLFEEQLSLVSGPNHPFFGRPRVAASELRDAEFVALSPQTTTGALILEYLVSQGLAPAPAMTTDNIETVKRLVEAGMGVAFLPDMVTTDDVAESCGPARLGRSTLDPPLTMEISIVTWREGRGSLAVDAFVEELRRLGRRWREESETPLATPVGQRG
jgi:LysR family transcriptional regulator, transcription activator of glutamate synthase operon